ncbi:MAG: protein kinase, partial [Deltaproteobacteria bacterium]
MTDGSLAVDARPGDPDGAERLIGRILAGRYEVLRVLGRGGMGIVYEARHVTVGRTVAIKVLRHDLARSTEAVVRFHREAKAAASIGSAHIVEVFDFGYSDEGDAYIAMELLEGEDLGRVVRREGKLPESRAVDIATQVARALQAAHAKGIIHRDLKSENVFIVQRSGSDFVKLLDFGISKVSEGDEGRGPMTSEGVVMGTPHYMAPEQAMSDVEPDARIDLYALGCLLYEMLTGNLPFTGKNPVEVVFKHVHEAPVPVRKVVPGLSARVERIVMCALEKKRDDRWATAAAFAEALEDDTAPAVGKADAAREASVARAASAAGRVSGAGRADGATEASTAVENRATRNRSPRMVLGLAGAAIAVIAGASAWQLRRTASASANSNTRGSNTGRSGASGVREAGTGTVAAHGPVVGADVARVGTGTATAVEARDTPLAITAVPRTATISIDDETFGTGSLEEHFVQGSAHRVVVQAAGFMTVTRDVVLDGPHSETIVLTALPTGTVTRAVRDAGRVVVVESGTASVTATGVTTAADGGARG